MSTAIVAAAPQRGAVVRYEGAYWTVADRVWSDAHRDAPAGVRLLKLRRGDQLVWASPERCSAVHTA